MAEGLASQSQSSLRHPSDPSTSGIAGIDMFDLLPDAYLILDGTYHIVRVNAQYLSLLGLTADALLGRSIFDINQWGNLSQRESRRDWLLSVFAGLSTQETVSSEFFRYDGAVKAAAAAAKAGPPGGAAMARYWSIRASRLAVPSAGRQRGPDDADLAANRFWVALRVLDVTDEVTRREEHQRERAQLRSLAQLRQQLISDANARLAQEKSRLDQAMSFAELGAWEWEPQTGTIHCTTQCKRILGLTDEDTLTEATFFDKVIDPRDRQRLRDSISSALQSRTYFEIDCRTTRLRGASVWILVRGSGRFTDERMDAVLGLMLDITERKEAELSREHLLDEERLARQRSDLRVDTMDGFVSSVSHELRSPLNAILSWTQLLQRTQDQDKIRQGVDVVSRNARQLSVMVGDLLDSGAIVSGKLTVRRAPLDLGALAGLVVEEMRPDAQMRGVDLITPSLHACAILGDESRLRQIVWNLLSNAMKFGERGPVALRVDVESGYAALRVQDSGVGIDGAALQHIFDRFQQLDNASHPTSAGRVGGLGLGLWLVKNLVELHDGTVEAHSEGRGLGATFVVRLPLYRQS